MVGACLGMLEHLECHGIVKLPPKRESMVRNAPALRRAHFRPRKERVKYWRNICLQHCAANLTLDAPKILF